MRERFVFRCVCPLCFCSECVSSVSGSPVDEVWLDGVAETISTRDLQEVSSQEEPCACSHTSKATGEQETGIEVFSKLRLARVKVRSHHDYCLPLLLTLTQ